MRIYKCIIFTIIILLFIGIAKAEDVKLNIRITSFWRSPDKQADLLINQHNRGVNISRLYRDKTLTKQIIKVMQEDNAKSKIIEIIREGISQGKYLSKHLCGKAIDIGKDKGAKDFIYFIKDINNLKILDEGNHYHIEVLTSCD